MIPDPLDKLAVADAALDSLAAGDTQASIAQALDIDPATVSRFASAHREELEARRDALATAAIEEGERSSRFRKMVRALLRSGRDVTNKGQAQAARVYGEYAKLIGGIRDVTINGDVDARSVSIDARRVAIVQGKDLHAIRAGSKRLADELGLNA